MTEPIGIADGEPPVERDGGTGPADTDDRTATADGFDSVVDDTEATTNGAGSTTDSTEATVSNPATANDPATADGTGAPADGRGVADLPEPILECYGLTKSFGGLRAVDAASFAVGRGSITGLIGPNGAGKSTTFDLVTGFTRVDAGSVRFDGADVTGLPPHQIAQRGLVRTFQLTSAFPDMTVLENLMVAPTDQRGESIVQSVAPGTRGRVVAEERELVERIWEALDRFELDHLATEYARTLSGGQRKLLELARALLTDPRLLLLDEPMAGVNPSLEATLLDRIHDLRAQGYSFLLVEHDVDLIMDHCDRVIVMHQGEVLASGEPAEVRGDERVIDAYLGEDV